MASSNAYFSPCKVNYTLAITGVRPDGFHNLLSLVAPTRLGDMLFVEEAETDSIECDLEGVPCDESNLVMKAAAIFREATGIGRHFKFRLEKKVPHGAGLGGGSSNGATALKAVNEICGSPLGLEDMTLLSARMGSDCPLFLTGRPVVMAGRGEKISFLPAGAEKAVKSARLLVFKPAFSINTGWAYKCMRESGAFYVSEESASEALERWIENPSLETMPLFNNMQQPAFLKYPALEAALDFVRSKYGVPAIMSGSGSACFAITNNLEADSAGALRRDLLERLGGTCFISEA